MDARGIKLVFMNTITGGVMHFSVGRRARGYTFLVLLSLLPFVSILIGGLAIAVFQLSEVTATWLGALSFLTGLVIILYVSTRLLLEDNQEPSLGDMSRLATIEAIIGSLVGGGILVICFLILVAVPVAREIVGKDDGIITLSFRWPIVAKHPGYETHEMPKARGNLTLIGSVTKQDGALAKGHLVLLFEGGYKTADILTDEKGHFSINLPPGDWHFQSPVIKGFENEWLSVEFSDPAPDGNVFHVGSSGTASEKTVHMLIAVEDKKRE